MPSDWNIDPKIKSNAAIILFDAEPLIQLWQKALILFILNLIELFRSADYISNLVPM